MHYIVGLGNPGEKYRDTRHNIGWSVLEQLIGVEQCSTLVESSSFSGLISEGVIGNETIKILLPTTFMNNSGSAVAKFVPKKEVERLLVVHDDIALPFGEVKIGKGRGAGGNNGVQSIISALDTKEFTRIRIGIAPKSIWTGKTVRPKGGGPLEQFVLKPFTSSEKKQLPAIIERARFAILCIVHEGVEVAMNKCNGM